MEHKCNSCFYKEMDKKTNPCASCEGYNKYVNTNVFQPDTISVKNWVEGVSGVSDKDFDNVRSPKHYTNGKFEVIDVIEDWDLNFRLANAVKYIARHKHKGKPLEDLKKAQWYLEREIATWNSHSKN